jgi:hypothetical protein
LSQAWGLHRALAFTTIRALLARRCDVHYSEVKLDSPLTRRVHPETQAKTQAEPGMVSEVSVLALKAMPKLRRCDVLYMSTCECEKLCDQCFPVRDIENTGVADTTPTCWPGGALMERLVGLTADWRWPS